MTIPAEDRYDMAERQTASVWATDARTRQVFRCVGRCDRSSDPLERSGQPQLLRLAECVEPHQHPAFVEADDLLLEPLETQLCGAAGKLVRVDAGEDGLLEFLTACVSLPAGLHAKLSENRGTNLEHRDLLRQLHHLEIEQPSVNARSHATCMSIPR